VSRSRVVSAPPWASILPIAHPAEHDPKQPEPRDQPIGRAFGDHATLRLAGREQWSELHHPGGIPEVLPGADHGNGQYHLLGDLNRHRDHPSTDDEPSFRSASRGAQP